MKSFKELPCWQEAIELEKVLYHLILNHHPADFLRVQIERAGNSIPANIAEEFGLKSDPGFIRHLNIALGSLSEIESHLESLKIRKPDLDLTPTIHKADLVRKSILGLKRYLNTA